jgi:hypothetical protein
MKTLVVSILTLAALAAPALGCSNTNAGGDTTTNDELIEAPTRATTVALYASSLGLGVRTGATHEAGVTHYQFAKGEIAYTSSTGTLSGVTVNGESLSKEVADLAVFLELGTFDSLEGAAGSTYVKFSTGGLVRVRNEDQTVGEVRMKAKTDDHVSIVGVPVDVAAAAVNARLGALVRISGAAGTAYYEFARGAAAYSNVSNVLRDVTLNDVAYSVTFTAGRLELGALVRRDHRDHVDHVVFAGGSVDYDTLSGRVTNVDVDHVGVVPTTVAELGANLRMGAVRKVDSGAGSSYYQFASGAVVRTTNETQLVSEVRLKAREGKPSEEAGSVPLDVARAASANLLGAFISSESAPGTKYFKFANGVVSYSSETESLADVTVD